MMFSIYSKFLLCCAAALLTAAPAFAQSPSFEGKTLRIVVGFGPGGGYDAYARLLSRSIGQHLPGKPNVVVENMPGAGSLTAVRWLDGPAPKDGTAIVAFNNGLITQSVLEPEKIGNVNFLNFAWIGNMAPDLRACYLWAEKGVKTFDEFRAKKGWNFGTTAPGVTSWVNMRTLQGLFDLDMKIITGFKGSAEIRLAIERGEIDGDCGSWSSISQDWIDNKKIVTILKLSKQLPPGAPNGVPYVNDIAKNNADRAVLNVINGATEIGRPIITSKQVPAEIQAVLRKAFNAALTGKGAQDEAAKMGLPLQPMPADEVVAELKQMYEAPPEAVRRARAIVFEK
jgi:tripartite-type tricarboxylate transporter receptor subunit TctC